MRRIISIGGGLSSTLVLPEYVVERHGREGVTLVMARLPNEDPDMWRLCDAVERRLGIPLTYIGLDKTPWDIFFEERMMGNTRFDPCSRRLKREVMALWMDENCDRADTILYVGITSHEIDRMASIRINWTRQGWTVEAPLADDATWTRERMLTLCQQRFGFVPRLYKYGFNHNNCGGACIKAGQKEWARLLRHLPDVYDWWEKNEERFRAEVGTPMTILRDRRGGTTKPFSLKDFREAQQKIWQESLPGCDPLAGLDETPACVFCSAT